MVSKRNFAAARTELPLRVHRSPHFPGVELIWMRPTRPYPAHVSTTAKIAVVSRGAKKYRYRGKSWIAPPGSVIFANAGEAHEGCPTGESFEVLMLSFEPGALSPVDATFEHAVLTDEALVGSVRGVCAAILGECTSPLHADEIIEKLAVTLGRRGQTRPIEARQTACEPTAVRRALNMLRDLYAAPLSLNDLARISRLPKPRFLRAFKQAVGLSPHRYQMQLRVDHAKRMIAAGTAIVEVSAATGFFDQSHFHRHFTRLVGVRPGSYRERCLVGAPATPRWWHTTANRPLGQ